MNRYMTVDIGVELVKYIKIDMRLWVRDILAGNNLAELDQAHINDAPVQVIIIPVASRKGRGIQFKLVSGLWQLLLARIFGREKLSALVVMYEEGR